MAHKPAISEDPSNLEVSPSLTSWTQILHSWFWRLYDHLVILVLCNALWFAGLIIMGWSFHKVGWLGTFQAPRFPGILTLCFLLALYSVGWAYGVFRLFTGQEFHLMHYWEGLKHFSFRAVFLSALWMGVALLSFWNFRLFPGLIQEWGFAGYLMEGLSLWVILYWFSMALYQWPLLFFQDVNAFKVIYRSFFLVFGNNLLSLSLLACLMVVSLLMSTFFLVGWAFVGLVVACSLPSVALEKVLLKYKITLFNQPLLPLLEVLEMERKRGWRELLKPWEFR